jgi:MOSC domain-containing protein YiiM
MWKGKVGAIYIAETKGMPMQSVKQARAVEGIGLKGDRYFMKNGPFSKNYRPDQEVTLVEPEAIKALKCDFGIELEPGGTKRNIVTSGVSLNQLVGQEFRLGEVILRGIKPCDPCSHLERPSKPGIKRGLTNRGGLRAQIITGGIIRVGDEIEGA